MKLQNTIDRYNQQSKIDGRNHGRYNRFTLCTLMLLAGMTFITGIQAQEKPMEGHVAAAKTAYAAKDLSEARYNMMMAMTALDIRVGEEILKILPERLDTLQAVKAEDKVSPDYANFGSSVIRRYGRNYGQDIELNIVNNSPLIQTLNAFFGNPMIAAGMGAKVVRIDDYKGRLQVDKSENTDANGQSKQVTRCELSIPIGSALITVTADNMPEDRFLQAVKTLPVGQIAKLMQ